MVKGTAPKEEQPEQHEEQNFQANKKPRFQNKPRTYKNQKSSYQHDDSDKYTRATFRPPTGWRDKLRDEVTLETVVPQMPDKESLLSEPNVKDLKQDIQKINYQIDDIEDDIDKLYDQKKAYVRSLMDKNKDAKSKLSALNREKRTKYLEPLEALFQEIKGVNTTLQGLKNKRDEILGRMNPKYTKRDQLVAEIVLKQKQLEEKLTAHQEAKVIEQLDRLKELLDDFPLLEKIKAEENTIRKKKEGISDKINKLKEDMEPINKEIEELRKEVGE